MKLKNFWKLFKLPTPSELGWSNSNALSMRKWSHGSDIKTWEDWTELIKKKYPIRYFLNKKLRVFFSRKIVHPIQQFIYWLQSHLIASKRYHMLDLRQPKSEKLAYRSGRIDADNQILYAIFNILNNFVRDEMSHFGCPSEENALHEPISAQQRNIWFEIKAIHYWWNVERQRSIVRIDELTSRWFKAHGSNHEESSQLWTELKEAEKTLEDKTDEMLGRVLKIRHSLWT